MLGTNTLAYFENLSITTLNGFIGLAHGCLFESTFYKIIFKSGDYFKYSGTLNYIRFAYKVPVALIIRHSDNKKFVNNVVNFPRWQVL